MVALLSLCTRYLFSSLLLRFDLSFHLHDQLRELGFTFFFRLSVISFDCKSEAVSFFEGRRLRLVKELLRCILAIIEESKKTFDLPYPDPQLKKMKLLPSPALGGR